MHSPLFGGGAVDRFQAHPLLPDATSLAAGLALARFNGSWLRNRLLNDRGRFLLALLLLDLHLNECGGRGVTSGRIRREALRYDICSGGRVTAFLAALRFGNFLVAACDVDEREKRLQPTQALLNLHHERWMSLLQAIAIMDADAVRRAEALPSDVFLSRCTGRLAELFRTGLRLLDLVPALHAFAERDAGIAMLLALYLAGSPLGTVTVADASRTFSVSRAHASHVLQTAQRNHLAVFHGPRLGYAGTAELKAVIERFYAVIFAVICYAIDV